MIPSFGKAASPRSDTVSVSLRSGSRRTCITIRSPGRTRADAERVTASACISVCASAGEVRKSAKITARSIGEPIGRGGQGTTRTPDTPYTKTNIFKPVNNLQRWEGALKDPTCLVRALAAQDGPKGSQHDL